MFDKINYWYKTGVWDATKVKAAVVKGKITQAQYKIITGEKYIK